ncbi:MAG TPA: VWA domain-containing protein [Thermoanaerobaculia bacterium]|jgi:VWFA-related protein|nr:VWA domain-containing protein [Thermoanaerobaculia bacterium]
MKTFTALLLLLAAPAFAASQKPPGPPAPPGFGEVVEVNVVNVDVYVTDKAGNRLTGLRKGDFELLEDGKPVEITNFEVVAGRAGEAGEPASAASAAPPAAPEAVPAPEDAWNLVVFIDNQNLRPANRARALRQLGEFVTRQLSPGDRVMLVTNDFGLHVRLPFSSDPAVISRALDEMGKLAAQGDSIGRERQQAFRAMIAIQEESLLVPPPIPCPLNIATPAHTFASTRRQEVLRTINTLTLLVNSLSGVPGRKAVLHVSDGIPLIPGEELFQFLVEICGGNGTGGISRTSTESATGTAGEGEDDEGPGSARSRRPREGSDNDPFRVFDARSLGPASYQAASQAPLDAQGYNVIKNLETLAAHANAHRVTLYTLQPGLHAPDASAADFGPEERLYQFPAIGSVLRANNRDSLQFLADSTGGRAILDANEFLPDLGRMHEDSASFYSLGFTPAHNGDGREHKLEVKVKRPGTRLRYRQTYRDKTAVEKVVDRTFAALYYGIEDNPLDITVEIGEQAPGPSGTVAVPIRLKIPLFKLAILNRDETFQGALKLFVITRSQDGGTSPVRQVAVPLQIPRKEVLRAMGQFYVYTLTLQLQPGEQQVAVAVRDDVGTTTSFLARGVKVAAVNPANPADTAAVKP